MEHMFSKPNCVEIAVFKEKHVFDILIILALGTSLFKSRFLLKLPWSLGQKDIWKWLGPWPITHRVQGSSSGESP